VEADRGQGHPARAAYRPGFEGLRNGSFDVAIEGNCQSVINPVLDVSKYQPRSASRQYGNFEDPKAIDLYQRMLHEDRSGQGRRHN